MRQASDGYRVAWVGNFDRVRRTTGGRVGAARAEAVAAPAARRREPWSACLILCDKGGQLAARTRAEGGPRSLFVCGEALPRAQLNKRLCEIVPAGGPKRGVYGGGLYRLATVLAAQTGIANLLALDARADKVDDAISAQPVREGGPIIGHWVTDAIRKCSMWMWNEVGGGARSQWG